MSGGAGDQFSFERHFDSPSTSVGPAPIQPPTTMVTPLAISAPRLMPAAAAPRPRRRGQLLAWSGIALTVLGSLAIGFGLYVALASIDVASLSVAEARDWMNLAVAGLCVLVVAFAISIVAIVRARPKLIAVLALIATLVLPVIACVVGVKLGVDVLIETGHEDLVSLAEGLLRSAEEVKDGGGFWSILRFLVEIFG